MTEDGKQPNPLFNADDQLSVDPNNNLTDDNTDGLNLVDGLEQELVTLQDGTQILKERVEEEEPEEETISDKDLLKLLEFTRNIKSATPEELEELRNDKDELERLLRISVIKSRGFNYNPKKHFGVAYKQKRKNKNRLVKASRKANR